MQYEAHLNLIASLARLVTTEVALSEELYELITGVSHVSSKQCKNDCSITSLLYRRQSHFDEFRVAIEILSAHSLQFAKVQYLSCLLMVVAA